MSDKNSRNIIVPTTRIGAIEAIADVDARHWGEEERGPSRALHRNKSYGLAMNTLANKYRFLLADEATADLIEQKAKAVMSASDRAHLRRNAEVDSDSLV